MINAGIYSFALQIMCNGNYSDLSVDYSADRLIHYLVCSSDINFNLGLRKLISVVNINAENNYGSTAFHGACYKGHREIVKLLIGSM